jgi:hypothetical protein
MFEAFGRIAGHRVEAPDLFAGIRVVRRKETTRGVIGPARSHNYLTLYDPNGRGEHGVGFLSHLGAPYRFAGFLVDSYQLDFPDRNCTNNGKWLKINGAGDGTRTRDVQLGKLAFYR